jgi:hypothetical protein
MLLFCCGRQVVLADRTAAGESAPAARLAFQPSAYAVSVSALQPQRRQVTAEGENDGPLRNTPTRKKERKVETLFTTFSI